MLEYRFSAADDDLDDFEEGTQLNVDDDMGDYEVEEEELIVTEIPVGSTPSGAGAESAAPYRRRKSR